VEFVRPKSATVSKYSDRRTDPASVSDFVVKSLPKVENVALNASQAVKLARAVRELRCLTDARARDAKESYLAERFPDGEFAILLRVPVVENQTLSPDLYDPNARLYEGRRMRIVASERHQPRPSASEDGSAESFPRGSRPRCVESPRAPGAIPTGARGRHHRARVKASVITSAGH
jgi:hypothetical protein